VLQATDEALLGRIAAGDSFAMELLYDRHKARVVKFLLKMPRIGTSVDDLTSEVFATVFKEANRFKPEIPVLAWILTIAQQKASAALRQSKTEHLEEGSDSWHHYIKSQEDDPETAITRKDQREYFYRMLDEMPPRYREVIDLIYFQDKSTGEAAKIIGVSTRTVANRLARARSALLKFSKWGNLEWSDL
jgi:RNA polymerase sigma-70 factor (ECF subfamily)